MLELRAPDQRDLDELADLAADGVHDPDYMPFSYPWTDVSPAERARSVLQHTWRTLGAWRPEDWKLNFAVVRDGGIVGTQSIGAKHFAVLREVTTGSWLGQRFHRQGIGAEMRAAVLHLAFVELAAECARSGAFADNAASRGVSRKLGYREDGRSRELRRGRAAEHVRLVLPRAEWTGRDDIEVEGLAPCLPLFGLDPVGD